MYKRMRLKYTLCGQPGEMPSSTEAKHQARIRRMQLTKERIRMEATRRAIQHEYLRELGESGFSFRAGEPEPRGIQARVVQKVNQMWNGRTRLKTNKSQVNDWVTRVRKNGYRATRVEQDYSKSSQNNRKFGPREQRKIRDEVRENELKCNEMTSVYSSLPRLKKRVSVSESTVRKYCKRPFKDEPSMVPAKPKGFIVGGKTAHHNKARLTEAKFWNSLIQEELNGIWFADESKMTFREHPNRQIDIKWVFRGEASKANWYEKPRHPGQINLFLVMSIEGIELYHIYKNNMNVNELKEMFPQIRDEINRSQAPFTFFMHDNAFNNSPPIAELNEYFGEGRWTKYMGKPCWKPSKTIFSPVKKLPARIPL